jgi:beta-ureidopropionase / N-carbamoyl-L-amino-acid hydrolase
MTSRPAAPAPPAPTRAPEAEPPRVDCERLKRDVLALGEIGRNPDDRGIYRMAFTDADMEGRRWLLGRMEEAGLTAWMDGAANVHGRLGEEGPPAVLIGSHTDTVPKAGMLDGALGVVAGLEVLGSEALAGLLTPESLHQCALDGAVLHEEMARHRLDPMGALDARRRPGTVDCYLELHIEQGPVLERCGETIGVVDHITGLFKWLVRFHGEANHAGTTPMDMRRDAFLGLAELATELPRLLEENGSERARATIGRAQILPGAPNTVPGEVEFSLDVRDTSADGLAELAQSLRKALAAIARRRGLIMDLEFQSEIAPVPCDPGLVELLASLAERAGVPHRRMPSGAAHDAQIVAGIAPIGMLFVPSRGGKSHTPEEWTDWDDVEAGANILLAAAAARAGAP